MGARLITSLADVSVTKALLTRRVEKPSIQTGGISLPSYLPNRPRLPMVFCTRPNGHEPEWRIETQMTTMATPLRRLLPAALFAAAVGVGGSALAYPAIASGEVATPEGETMTTTQNTQLLHRRHMMAVVLFSAAALGIAYPRHCNRRRRMGIGSYDRCIQAIGDSVPSQHSCCDRSGGVWIPRKVADNNSGRCVPTSNPASSQPQGTPNSGPRSAPPTAINPAP